MAKPALDPTEFIKEMKKNQGVLRWEPLPPADPNRQFGVEQVRNRASLDFLHHHWQLPNTYEPSGAESGGGLKGKFIGIFGRMTFRVLGPYLRDERDLLSHVVRINEALERRCDQLTDLVQELNSHTAQRQVAEAKNLAALAIWLDASVNDQGAEPAS